MIWTQIGIIVIFTAIFAAAIIQGKFAGYRWRQAGLWLCLLSSTFLLVLTGFWLYDTKVHGAYVALGYFGLEAGLIVILLSRVIRNRNP